MIPRRSNDAGICWALVWAVTLLVFLVLGALAQVR